MRLFATMLLFAIFPASNIQAGNLGRLFFTPEQRAQLDDSHARNATADGSDPPSMLMVNGIVQHHGGARTVWINGAAQNAGHGSDSFMETVAVPGKIQPIKIKVGEKLLLDTATPQSSPAPSE
jgi:hypothetical protein